MFVRFLMFIYINQKCYVKWKETRSYSFTVNNGTRQGSVFSPRGGFGTYLDPLLQQMRESGHGCFLGLHWYGALAYADDLLLLSPSVQGLQKLVDICENHAKENDLLFSTDPDPEKSKTKCLAFNCKNRKSLSNIVLDGNPLPWKEHAKHIGNTLHEDGTMNKDIKCKRAEFINKCINMNQEFQCISCQNQVKLLRIYNSHFTGSCLWSFDSENFKQLTRSWNVNLRIPFDLPLETPSWIVEQLSNGRHAKQVIMKMYIKFLESLVKSTKPAVQALVKRTHKDVRTHTGANIRHILLETGILVTPGETKSFILNELCVYEVPKEHEWKKGLLISLLEIRDSKWMVQFDEESENFNEDEVQLMIDNVCTS